MVVFYPLLSHSYGKGYSVKQHFWVFYRQVLVAIPLNQQYIRTLEILNINKISLFCISERI